RSDLPLDSDVPFFQIRLFDVGIHPGTTEIDVVRVQGLLQRVCVLFRKQRIRRQARRRVSRVGQAARGKGASTTAVCRVQGKRLEEGLPIVRGIVPEVLVRLGKALDVEARANYRAASP